jgi:hypothetical protein
MLTVNYTNVRIYEHSRPQAQAREAGFAPKLFVQSLGSKF